jgi:hypothetical protein
MKHAFLIAAIAFISSCSSSKDNTEVGGKDSVGVDTLTKNKEEERQLDGDFVKSTYDDTVFAARVAENREKLKNLHDKKVFAQIHEAMLEKMSDQHKHFFGDNPGLEMLAAASGRIFGEGNKDAIFIVYDNKNACLSFVAYNEDEKTYNELYRDINVENGLKDANCNYFSFGTIDYQLADEIILQTSELLNNPLNYLEFVPLKIVDIEKDDTFLIKQGCISKAFKKGNNCICISTSMVYNNWECLQYDEAKKKFVIVYGQAFAD